MQGDTDFSAIDIFYIFNAKRSYVTSKDLFLVAPLFWKVLNGIVCIRNFYAFIFNNGCHFTSITRLPLGNGSIVFGQNFRCRVFTWFICFEGPWVQKVVFGNWSVPLCAGTPDWKKESSDNNSKEKCTS